MRLAITLLFFMVPIIAFAQFGANFHQTNIPFVGINYEIRIGSGLNSDSALTPILKTSLLNL